MNTRTPEQFRTQPEGVTTEAAHDEATEYDFSQCTVREVSPHVLEVSMNNNAQLIDGLRQLADFLESKPEMPDLSITHLRAYMWQDRDMFVAAARQLGSFDKVFDDANVELHRKFAGLSLQIVADRSVLGCKKIVTWDCPDESLLKLVESETA